MASPQSFKLLLPLFLLCSFHAITISYTNPIPTHTTKSCHDHERSALSHFKKGLSSYSSSSAYSKTASWKAGGNSSFDCCSWDGVECDDATGHVIGLDLSGSLIHATLHSNNTLFSLVHLQNLNLADNDFMNSSIPPEISHLSRLSSINLSYSSFAGQIPLELTGMSRLTSLDFSHNNLYGDFPVAIFSLPSLLVLNVSDNQNLNGYLPEFNTTSSFRELNIASTNFSGNIPPLIRNLQSLTLLNLNDTNLHGDIPPSLADLTQLTHLYLSNNPFNKSRNLSWLGKLTKLTVLYLKHASLYGDIPPSLANLTQLTQLSLQHNNFVGEIPSWLMNMTQLITLDLRYNELTGRIPRTFSQLKNLEYLSLGYNNFTGTVDVDIFLSSKNLTFLNLSNITLVAPHQTNVTLSKLEIIILRSCSLTEFPYFLQFQSNLKMLQLDVNKIHGYIPHWIWIASNSLESISLSNNYLTAFERNPVAVQSKSLRFIDISNNMLQGNLPVPPPNTILYNMHNNRLTGDISPMICLVMSLKVLDLSNNSMSGPIPQFLADSLEALVLQDNNFSGIIPQVYPKECNLKVMDLSHNQLTGEVPKSLSNCKMLKILDLSNNRIEQTFPTWLGTLLQLQVLILHSNIFHGEIGSPRNPSEFPMLSIIDLSHNSLSGALPVEYIQIWNTMKVFRTSMEPYIKTNMSFTWHISNGAYSTFTASYYTSITLTNKGVETEYQKISNIFTAIDLSGNKFTGQIPESLGSLEALQLLDLSNNDLTGPIPPSLGNLTHLESLDLSKNKLSGVIPEQLAAQLNFLAFFNVSDNLLSDHIPQGPQFKTFDNNSYMENSGLCGFPLSKNCGTEPSPADENEDNPDEDKFPSGFDWLFILVGLGSGLLIGFVMGDILTDRHPWLICKIVQKTGR
ncbi:receptor-like protein 54 [Apium graveolens]